MLLNTYHSPLAHHLHQTLIVCVVVINSWEFIYQELINQVIKII